MALTTAQIRAVQYLLPDAINTIDYEINKSGLVALDQSLVLPTASEIAAAEVDAAIAATRSAAINEAVRRMSLANELFDSVDSYLAFEAIFTTLVAAVPTLTAAAISNNLQEPLASIKAIRDAYMLMRTEINALATVEDCESYIAGIAADVASSPRTVNWP